jgi:hypothetical protein
MGIKNSRLLIIIRIKSGMIISKIIAYYLMLA